MTKKVLCVGLGGLGVVACYTLQTFNTDVEVTAIIRSDFDVVTTKGYTISSVDYGGRRPNGDDDEVERAIKGFRPTHIVKDIAEAASFGPYDYIVVSTKVIPNTKHAIWREVGEHENLLLPNRESSIVLIQNGIDPERYWQDVKGQATLISGVSYISSVNTSGFVTQYGHDNVMFGLFDRNDSIEKVEAFIEMYNNPHNSVLLDPNVRYTRWKKLLYNASFNTVCCLTNLDIGELFDLKDKGIIDQLIYPLMKEVQLAANKDLELNYSEHPERILDDNITYLLEATEATDGVNRYQPSMLVDFRNHRPIELEVILANAVAIHEQNISSSCEARSSIPNLNFLLYSLTLVQNHLFRPSP